MGDGTALRRSQTGALQGELSLHGGGDRAARYRRAT